MVDVTAATKLGYVNAALHFVLDGSNFLWIPAETDTSEDGREI
jgi:hypothetical protein